MMDYAPNFKGIWTPRDRHVVRSGPGGRLTPITGDGDRETAFHGWLEMPGRISDSAALPTFDRGHASYSGATVASEGVTLYRSVACTTGLYVRRNRDGVAFSTNPTDLFGDGAMALRKEEVVRLIGGLPCSPRSTPFAGIDRLLPGDMYTFDRHGNLALKRIAKLRKPLAEASVDESVGCLREAIGSFARSRLSPTQRVTILLSGGIDSSVMAYEFAQHAEVEAVHTTCPSVSELAMETVVARSVAESIGISLREVAVEPAFEKEIRPDLDRHLEFLRSVRGYRLDLPAFWDDDGSRLYRELAGSSTRLGTNGLLSDTIFPSTPWWTTSKWRQGVGLVGEIWHQLANPFLPIGSQGPAGLFALLLGLNRNPPYRNVAVHEVLARLLTPSAREIVNDLVGSTSKESEWNADVSRDPMYRVDGVSSEFLDAIFEANGHIPATGYASRLLVELGASLPRELSDQRFLGETFDKVALRAAYAGRLPARVTGRKQSLAYSAVQALSFTANYHRIASLLDDSSLLASLGIIDVRRVQDFLRAPAIARMGFERHMITLAAGVEAWLRFALDPDSAHYWLTVGPSVTRARSSSRKRIESESSVAMKGDRVPLSASKVGWAQ